MTNMACRLLLKEQQRRMLNDYNREELLELCLNLLESEKEKQKELDKIKGIIR